MKEVNEAIPVDRKESGSVNPLGVMPRESEKELVWRPSGLVLDDNGEIDGGAQQSNSSIGRLIATCTRRPLL